MARLVIGSFAAEYRRYRGLAEAAASQLTWEELRIPLDPEVNSVAVVMKHIAGNLSSRWTDALTTDGEKPWRNRDTEFIDDFHDRAEIEALWARGWGAVEGFLASIDDADLGRTVLIRGESHTVASALARSLSHTSYHVGQVVQTSRALVSRAGRGWRVLTVPRGGSEAFNRSLGFGPRAV